MDFVGPEVLTDDFARDDRAAVGNQQLEQSGGLRLKSYRAAVAGELQGLGIEAKVSEVERTRPFGRGVLPGDWTVSWRRTATSCKRSHWGELRVSFVWRSGALKGQPLGGPAGADIMGRRST